MFVLAMADLQTRKRANYPDLKAGKFSTNWEKLKQTIGTPKKERKMDMKKRGSTFPTSKAKRTSHQKRDIWFDDVDIEEIESGSVSSSSGTAQKKKFVTGDITEPTTVIAMDCEMVGTGKTGESSVLARCSIVNSHGNVLLDKYGRPKERVTDFRTSVSGIRPKNLKEASTFEDIQKDVAALLTGRILVGHAIHHDLKVLMLSHPFKDIRDTSKYKPLKRVSRGKTPSLKRLAKAFLDVEIQTGEHSSVEDAQVVMKIYQMHKKQWEASLRDKYRRKQKHKP